MRCFVKNNPVHLTINIKPSQKDLRLQGDELQGGCACTPFIKTVFFVQVKNIQVYCWRTMRDLFCQRYDSFRRRVQKQTVLNSSSKLWFRTFPNRVTRLGNFCQLSYFLRLSMIFWKDVVAQNKGNILAYFLLKQVYYIFT